MKKKKLYNLVYNTRDYIVNEKYTKKELCEKGLRRQAEREREKRKRGLQKQLKEKKKEYAKQHEDKYRTIKTKKLIKVIENYSKKYRNDDVNVYNLPVKGEYVFECNRMIWQKAIYDTFIFNRNGKIIQLAKIDSWVKNYSGLKYFKEFDYSKDEIWDSRFNAIKNYLTELEKYEIVYPLNDHITKWGEIRVRNGNKDYSNDNIKKKYKSILVCKECGEIFDNSDIVNCCYLTNFEMDKECFQRKIDSIVR